MRPSQLDNETLALFATNVATLLGGTELAAIDSNVRADLATAMGTLPDTLASEQAATVVAKTAWRTEANTAKDTRTTIIGICNQTRNAIAVGLGDDSQYILAGFDPPNRRHVIPRPPNTPGKLAATGSSNGNIKLKWVGNNKGKKVIYEIFRRTGDTVDFSMIATATKQKYTDIGLTPGEYCEYALRAKTAGGESGFTNHAVVYAHA